MTIVINLDKAKEIKKKRIRAERAELFGELDAEFMRAIEVSDKELQEKIVKKKQLLRDAPAHESVVGASTVEELKAADPLSELRR